MLRTFETGVWALLAALGWTALGQAGEIQGAYMEARTCQVYTGPCFANSEVALTGRDAIMAWSIKEGEFADVDLGGLNVVLVVNADATLGFRGLEDAQQLESIVLVDERADASQRDALVQFVKQRAAKAGATIVRVDSAPITMSLDLQTLTGQLTAGREVKLETRKAKPTDCIKN